MQTLLTSRDQERGERYGRETERDEGDEYMGSDGGTGAWQGVTPIHAENGEGSSLS